MSNKVEFNVETMIDSAILYTYVPYNLPEILIKPVVQEYYILKNMEKKINPDSINFIGTIYSKETDITYSKELICIKINYNFSRYKADDFQRNYFTSPYKEVKIFKDIYNFLKFQNADKDYDVTINIRIPSITNFFWNILNDFQPEFNQEVIRVCPLAIGFFLPCNCEPYNFYGKIMVHGNDYDQWYDGGNCIYINGSYLDSSQREFIYAAILWKQKLWKRIFNNVVCEINYYPGVGVEYFKAQESFYR